MISCQVGEVERFTEDGESAFLAAPGDASAFAARILAAVADPVLAERVGANGRMVADREFDYRRHGARLRRFMERLGSERSARRIDAWRSG